MPGKGAAQAWGWWCQGGGGGRDGCCLRHYPQKFWHGVEESTAADQAANTEETRE